jgi:capsular exopolysaccharide synthesis family protein
MRPEEAPGGEPRKTLFDRIDGRLAEKVVADTNMSAVSREQYRRLAAVLHDAQGNNGLRVIMVASAAPGEGKTLTATNVALTLSDSYRRRVLLIDADLRRPTLHHVFRLNTTSGLIDGLESSAEVKLVLRQVSPYLSVLPAGRPTSDPMAGLTSVRMRRLIDEAKETFDWVIIDTPPLMLLPDAHLLSSLVDGAVLVIKANSTPHDMVKRTVDIIGRERVIGVVLNQAESHAHHGGYGGYGGYYSRYYLAEKTDAPQP